MYNYETLGFFKVNGVVLGWSILVALVLIGVSSFTFVVLRKINDKAVTGSYAVMLLLALLWYASLAYKAPSIKGT